MRRQTSEEELVAASLKAARSLVTVLLLVSACENRIAPEAYGSGECAAICGKTRPLCGLEDASPLEACVDDCLRLVGDKTPPSVEDMAHCTEAAASCAAARDCKSYLVVSVTGATPG